MKFARQFFLLIFFSYSAVAQTGCTSCSILDDILQSETSFPDSYYAEYDFKAFEKLSFANDTIDFSNPDIHLMNAAVFYMSDKKRNKLGKKPIAFSPKLRNAALVHSISMVENNFFNHVNLYEDSIRTNSLRAALFGVEWNRLAENIAIDFLLNYDAGKQYYTEIVNNKTKYYYANTDKEFSAHTYLSLGVALVESWYESNAHKKIFTSDDYKFLGCGVMIDPKSLEQNSFPKIKATQTYGSED